MKIDLRENKYIIFLIALSVIFVIKNIVFNYLTNLEFTGIIELMATSFAFSILLMIPVLYLSKKSGFIYLIVSSLVFSLIMFAQFTYFRNGLGFISASALKFGWQTLFVGEAIGSRFHPLVLIFFLDLVVIALFYTKNLKDSLKITNKHKWLKLFSISALVGYALTLIITSTQYRGLDTFIEPRNNETLVSKLGIVNYSVYNTIKYLTRGKISPAEIAESQSIAHKIVEKNKKNPKHFGLAKNRNVYLIHLESFENWVIGRSVNGKEITPNLNKFLKDGVYLSDFYDHIGPGTTSDAEFTILNSLYPIMDGAVFFEYPNTKYHTILHDVGEEGYYRTSFHADNKNFWNRATMYPRLGYQRYFSKEDFGPGREFGWGLSDEDFFDQSVDKIKELPKPHWATLIAVSSHTPFAVPDDLKAIDVENLSELGWLQKNYINSAHYVDMTVGKLIEKLKKEGLYENSLIVVYGDHQASLADEHGHNFAKFLGYQNGFDEKSYLESKRVFGLIHVPGTDLKGEISRPTSQLDFYPTILNLLGIKPKRITLGADLFNETETIAKRSQGNNNGLKAVLRDEWSFFSSANSDFDAGACLNSMNTQIKNDVCKEEYEKWLKIIKLSDVVIRANRVDLLEY